MFSSSRKPAKNKAEPRRQAINMEAQLPLRSQERENWDFFLSLPNPDRRQLKLIFENKAIALQF